MSDGGFFSSPGLTMHRRSYLKLLRRSWNLTHFKLKILYENEHMKIIKHPAEHQRPLLKIICSHRKSCETIPLRSLRRKHNIRPNSLFKQMASCLDIVRNIFLILFLQLLNNIGSTKVKKCILQRIFLKAHFELFCRIFGHLATLAGD